MQVAKWGNSLAVRLPAELVRELGLKEGDQIDLVKDDGRVRVRRLARADEVLTGLRRFRGKLSAAERLSRRKAGLSWEEAAAFLEGVRALCPVEDLTVQTHDVGRALAERYGFSIYDAMIVASALVAGCTTLWSEDMQDGLLVEGQLRIVNPFT